MLTQFSSPDQDLIPKLFPGVAERQNNIIVCPTSDKVHFIQLADLDANGLAE